MRGSAAPSRLCTALPSVGLVRVPTWLRLFTPCPAGRAYEQLCRARRGELPCTDERTKVEAPTMYKIPQSPDVTFSQRSRAANRWTCLGTRRTRVPSETRARCHPCTCPTSRLRKPRPTRRRVSASTAGAAATRSDALGRAEHVHLQQRCCRSRLVRARKERGASGLVGLLELERRGSTSSAMSMVSEAILRLCPSTNAFAR